MSNSRRPADAGTYQLPSKQITDALDAPVPPRYVFSADRTKVLQMRRPPPYPPIRDFMLDELKLAGVRIDARLRAPSRLGKVLGLSVLDFDPVKPDERYLGDLPTRPLQGVPPGMVLNYIRWAPSSHDFTFTLRSAGGDGDPTPGPLSLWLASADDPTARRVLPDHQLNSIIEDYVWVGDDALVVCVIPPDQKQQPAKPEVPPGPKISDNSQGRTSKARTYPDLLQNKHDEELFEWLCTSQLAMVNVANPGNVVAMSPPRMYASFSPSPDGRFLIVSWIERPFSYELPIGRFPRVWEVWDREFQTVHEICRLPLLDNLPVEFDAVREGPRSIGWRPDQPCTLRWVEARDGGDPKRNPDADTRDAVFTLDLSEPVDQRHPKSLATTSMRYAGMSFADDNLALLYESMWKTRKQRVWRLRPGDAGHEPELLFERSFEDRYNDPGMPLTIRHPSLPTAVLARVDGTDKLLMKGQGASPEGNRPFLTVLDLETKENKEIWRSEAPYYEAPGTIMIPLGEESVKLDGLKMLFTRETVRDPPQSYLRVFTEGATKFSEQQLTNEPHPCPRLRDLQKQVLEYERSDGVKLSSEFYLPPGYDQQRDGPLPCVLWAYPREFKSKAAAGQLNSSPHEFSTVRAESPLIWLAKGCAVLLGPSMPIVAEGDEEPNDTFVQQLVASAEAVVDKVVELGVVDRKRILVGGHSYGAFMAANLLAHAPDLFAAGLAQAGAFNRTLTPFGFQAEERSLWDAPEVYAAMAPFNNANKIKKPLLLIHGEADNNSGTFPMQSERMFSALQGHGCVSRLVLLPYESHGFQAEESIKHVLYEVENWLEAYVLAGEDGGASGAGAGEAST